VDSLLRQAITASLAGDHASARAVFEAVLEPISSGDIFLGQDESVDEVLSVDLHECLVRLLTAVYLTTPLEDRPNALVATADSANGYLRDPIEEIASAIGAPVPELDAFLPLWIARLEELADDGSDADWESDYERWLRAAVGQREGVGALVAAKDWTPALAAYEECSQFVESDFSRGDFVDGAALDVSPTARQWAEALRARTTRFYAFQEELRLALAGASGSSP
jgi:hypothetical protein